MTGSCVDLVGRRGGRLRSKRTISTGPHPAAPHPRGAHHVADPSPAAETRLPDHRALRRGGPPPRHESTLDLIALGERLGFDSAWLRHRHLQYGISSPIAVLAAATQRTSRIQLGTAVTPLGWENPLRLAEDLATVDVLSGGRLNPGFSVGPPTHYEQVRGTLYPDTGEQEDFSPRRAERLLALVRGEDASDFAGTEGIEVYSRRVQPHSPGLASRLWYGAGSLRSARWAGEQGSTCSPAAW